MFLINFGFLFLIDFGLLDHNSKVLEACSAAVEVCGLHGISRRLHSNSNSQCLLFYTVIPDFKIPSICKPLFKDQSY